MSASPASALPLMESPPGPSIIIDGRRYLYFAGTGYLGLQDNPEIIEAMRDAASKYGINSATSRASFGNTPPVLEVEQLAAEFFARDDAFYFPTGYSGNFILASALADRVDAVFIDERAYACLQEAAPILQRPVYAFRHADPEDLRNTIRTHLKPAQRPLVMTDGIFSVRGDIAPLADYDSILSGYEGATLLIDDAHGVGVLGENGWGTFEAAGLYDRANLDDDDNPHGPRLMFCATLGKALGGYGGIVPGSRAFVERVRRSSHWFDCSSAPPTPIAAATARALQLVIAHPEFRARLQENISLLRAGLRQLGLTVDVSPVPIIFMQIGDRDNMRRIQNCLQQRGIVILYRDDQFHDGSQGALRMVVFATHTAEMIGQFLETLRSLL